MRVTVCELPNRPDDLERAWHALVGHARSEQSDFVLLPEMPFAPWLASAPEVQPDAWLEAVATHDGWMPRLEELGADVVAGTRPVIEDGVRLNRAFFHRAGQGTEVGHAKTFLPDEAGFHEARWYSRGATRFTPVGGVAAPLAGFLICTELWFFDRAREYMRQGVELLLNPRATLIGSIDKWLAGGRAAAAVSGAYCLSSNFSGAAEGGQMWGGQGWVIDPEEADVLGVTSPEQPFLTVEIDLERARRAKSTYPRYVDDRPVEG